eukprot:Rhum_TRINITY_DN4454_c0_g1::Rhum_TRINITY_DN4454_c0_g1_i1::g.14443::m.14443/K20858/MCU; calcium uniporter protein, mitochondrial
MLVHLRSGMLAGARAHSLRGAAACVAAPRLSSSNFPHLAARRHAGGSAAGTAPAEGEVVAELQKLLDSKQCVPVEEAAAQLNFGDADLKAAIEQLEASGEVFRYARRGRFDVLVASPEKVILQALAKQSPEALANELNELHSLLAAKRVELADLEKVKEACDEVARKHPDKFATLGMMGMTGLWCLLFWMVFAESMFGCETFAFDWNLVEPITYFLGYSLVWFGVVFYYFTGQEYTYDTVRDLLEQNKRAKLYANANFDLAHFESLRDEVAQGEKKAKELTAIRDASATASSA